MTKNLHKTTLIRFVSSLKLTVICLLILIIIIIWGTVYQSNNGLFQAQQKFFHSWVFFIFGFIPFPGTNLTLTILFLNLIASMVFRIGLKWQKSGIILIHLGIIVLLVGGFISSFSSSLVNFSTVQTLHTNTVNRIVVGSNSELVRSFSIVWGVAHIIW